MECRRCGAQISDDSAFCSACGQPTAERASDSAESAEAPQSEPRALKPHISYAGFWLRLVAYVIDNILLGFAAAMTFLGPLMRHAGISTTDPWVFYKTSNRQVLAIELIMIMVQWLYWALLESSSWQATIGKKLLGLYVTDAQGHRVSLPRASARFFAKMISTLTIGLGYLIAGFTPKKQALHDMIAQCLVLKKTSVRR